MLLSATTSISACRAPRSMLFSLLTSLLLLPPVELAAQAATVVESDSTSPRRLQLSIGGGFAKVSSSPLNRTNQGYQMQAGVGIESPFRPLRLSVEGLFSEAGSTRLGSVTANAILTAPVPWSARPYLVTGGGAYSENGSRITSGFNFGLGLNARVGDQTLFMESRFHTYRDAYAGQAYVVPNGVVATRRGERRYLWQPLTFGFRF